MGKTDPETMNERIQSEVGRVIVGNEEIVEGMFIALLTRGHVLLEGVPGVAKTSLANAFTRATGLKYSRIQMTPDLLPADIIGTEVYYDDKKEFELQRGPIFSNIVVADEINRATPKTQSALLEAMQERRVTISGESYDLPTLFMVIATQNPIEMRGVFELPEAQRDRFQLKLAVEIPSTENQRRVLDRFDDEPDLEPEHLEQIVSVEEILQARERVESVYVDEKIKQYILSIAKKTREHGATEHGASTRAAVSFMNACKAQAAIRGREYVIPGDVNRLAESVLAHRIVLSADAEMREQTPDEIVRAVVSTIEIPQEEAVKND
jgi:MoxR-like ATPase